MTQQTSAGGPLGSGVLGFGCAYITGGFEAGSNARLLRKVFDAGIRHFDTAPMYGRGTSEAVLGQALAGLRDQITITSKVGIPRPAFSLKSQLIRAVATPVRKLLPGLSRSAASGLYRPTAIRKDFSALAVRHSVEESLRLLRTDRLDILLLHEAVRSEITDELLDMLAKLKAEGKALRIGIGSPLETILDIEEGFPGRFEVFQHSWSVLNATDEIFAGKINIYHRSVMEALQPLQQRMGADAGFAARLAKAVGSDLGDQEELGKILLAASLAAHPAGLTLFGTRQAARAMGYAREAASPAYLRKGAALLAACRA